MSSLLLACNLAIHNINSNSKSYYKTKTILSAAKAGGQNEHGGFNELGLGQMRKNTQNLKLFIFLCHMQMFDLKWTSIWNGSS